MEPRSLLGPVVGAEERRVRAARRFTWIALVLTVLWMVGFPVLAFVSYPPPARYTVPLVIGSLLALALHAWRIREHVHRVGALMGWPFVLVASVLGLGIAVVGVASSPVGIWWTIMTGVLLGDIVVGRRPWTVLISVAVATVLVGVLTWWIVIRAPWAAAISPTLVAAVAGFYVAFFWTVDFERMWWLKSVLDLDDSRRTAAELATARERLRLADDLHDILGHALQMVAVKSELAARLVPVDAERALGELEAVQRVARESLREVRLLVADRRPTDLATELAGARAVLTSAGVELTVSGRPEQLTGPARALLGRVLREAMTNLLRHADATRCSVTIFGDAGTAGLRVVNDGVRADSLDTGGDRGGTGLARLARLVGERGGGLASGAEPDGTFWLRVTVPGHAAAASEPTGRQPGQPAEAAR